MDNMNYCLSKFLLSIFLSAFTRYVCRHANKEHVLLSQTRFRQSDVWIRPERLNLDSHYQLCPVYTGPPCYVPWVIVFRSAQRCTQKSTFFCSFPSLSTLPYFALRKHWPQSPGRRVCVCGGGHGFGNMPSAFPFTNTVIFQRLKGSLYLSSSLCVEAVPVSTT